MSEDGASDKWWQLPTYVVEPLTYALGGGVLASVLVALALGQWGVLPDSDATFYVTEIAVPLLTFTGFLAVYLGFRSQEDQNELQEEQLRKQQDNFQKDRFESTFFQLLRTHNQVVDDILFEQWRPRRDPESLPGKIDSQPPEYTKITGRSCFELFQNEFEDHFKDVHGEDSLANPAHPDYFRDIYEEWYKHRKAQLNHYFNNLSKIISYVDESEIEDLEGVKDKQFYIDLVIAQMSVPELVLFFYHEAAMLKRKDYVEGVYDLLGKYTFFDQIKPERSLIHERHRQLHPRALGE